jgi:hypothetical protein
MRRDLQLENHWSALMSLCGNERLYQASGRHPKLLRLVSEQIDHLGRDMGFSERQIKTREFRAEKSDGRIVRIIADSKPPVS